MTGVSYLSPTARDVRTCLDCKIHPAAPSKLMCWRCRLKQTSQKGVTRYEKKKASARMCIAHRCLAAVIDPGGLYCPDHDRTDLSPEAIEQLIKAAPAHPHKYPYECTCMVCGRGAGMRWTEAQAQRWMQASVLRCGFCRGAILIERADLGHIGSASRGRVA